MMLRLTDASERTVRCQVKGMGNRKKTFKYNTLTSELCEITYLIHLVQI